MQAKFKNDRVWPRAKTWRFKINTISLKSTFLARTYYYRQLVVFEPISITCSLFNKKLIKNIGHSKKAQKGKEI